MEIYLYQNPQKWKLVTQSTQRLNLGILHSRSPAPKTLEIKWSWYIIQFTNNLKTPQKLTKLILHKENAAFVLFNKSEFSNLVTAFLRKIFITLYFKNIRGIVFLFSK